MPRAYCPALMYLPITSSTAGGGWFRSSAKRQEPVNGLMIPVAPGPAVGGNTLG